MQLSKKIKINHNNYYIIIDVEYKKKQNNFPILCLKNYKDDYWDGGDCSLLIEEIQKNYTLEKAGRYDKYPGFMSDILYIYDRIPFISGIKDIYICKNDNIPYAEGYISKKEIENFIKEFAVEMDYNSDFKLNDSRTWKL